MTPLAGALLLAAIAAEECELHEHRLAVVPVIVADDRAAISISSIFDDVVGVASERPSLEMISYEEMFVADERLADRVRDCGPDAACVSDELAFVKAEIALVVVLNLAVTPPLVALRLIATDGRKTIGSSAGSFEVGTASASEVIRARARTLLDEAGHAARGRILVTTAPAGATVTITAANAVSSAPNGTCVERTGVERASERAYLVAPGRWSVRGELEGYLPVVELAEVAGGKEAQVALRLEEDTSIWSTPWPWIGAAIAVVAGAATVFIVTRSTSCVCLGPPGAECPPC